MPAPAFWVDGAGDGMRFGPDLDHDAVAKLLGPVQGRRVIELGCLSPLSVALARRGAKVITVDPSSQRLAAARAAAEAADVRVEFHQGDLAELAFVRADRVDLAVSVYALSEVGDLSRVFRQVHRVLRTEAPFLITLPHPMSWMTQLEADGALRMVRTAFDSEPVRWRSGDVAGTTQPHRISDVFTLLTRANFRVDTLVEPRPERPGPQGSRTWSAQAEWVPTTVVLRGRKQGN